MNKPNAEIFCNWKNEFLQFFCYTSLIALRFSSRGSFGYLCNGLSKKILYEQIQIEGLISLQSNVNNSLGQTPPDTRKSGFSIESLMEPYLSLFLIVGLSLASFYFAAAESAFFCLIQWQTRCLAKEHADRGELVSQLLFNPKELISSLTLGSTIANLFN